MGFQPARSPRATLLKDRDRAPQRFLDRLSCDSSGAENRRLGAGEIHNRRFEPYVAGAAVHDEIDVASQIVADMPGGGRAHLAEPIGRRGRDPAAEIAQHRKGQRMRGNPQANGLLPAGHLARDPIALPENHRY